MILALALWSRHKPHRRPLAAFLRRRCHCLSGIEDGRGRAALGGMGCGLAFAMAFASGFVVVVAKGVAPPM
jgi:hypothetical protein